MIAGGGGGANANYAGGDGGTGGGNSTSIGVNGTGAGGGGYSGGKAGAYVLHTHTTACNHHTHGDSCYITHVCSSSCSNPCKYAHQHTAKPSGSGSDGQRIGCYVYNNVKYHVCSTCNNAYGFYDDATGQHCNNCKNTTVKWYDGWDWRISCNTTSEKELICTLTEGYQCGKTESSVDSYAQSEGGTNYIYNGNNCSNTVSSTHSIAENGKFNITSGLIGFQESVFSFNDVPAADKVAPNLMSAAKIESLSETKRRITLTPPSDRGSTYYHKVESFVISSGKIDTNSKLTSNITTNVLTTGVAKYYYRIDTNSTGNVTTSDKTTTSTTLEYTLTGTSTYYIHFAAMDVAGNLGATQHTKIGKLSDPPPPPPQNDYTNEINTKLLFVEETETGSLYKADSKNYYVRADGKTEYIIPITAELKEKAINEYMIDKIRLSVNSPGKEWSEIIVPRTSISTATTEFSNDDVSINQSKETLTYLNITSSTATRNNYCKSLTINPTFTVSAAHSGKTITVYPTAYVNYSGLKQSNSTTDGNNAINIIGKLANNLHIKLFFINYLLFKK